MNATQTLVTFGKFDGVHLGHRKILTECVALAKSKGLASVALILDTNVTPNVPGVAENSVNEKPVANAKPLTTLHERQRLIKALGVDYVVTQKLNDRFKALTSDQFLRDVLQTRLGASMVILGPGQQFGVDWASFQTFSNAQPEFNSVSAPLISPAVSVALPPSRLVDTITGTVDGNSPTETLELAEMTEFAMVDGERVSSHAIRQAIQQTIGQTIGQQNFDLVNRMLGRRYALRGLVVMGEQRGRQIGFPTANLTQIETVIPPPGVYHCRAKVHNQFFPAAVSIGFNQTFGTNLPMSVEAHIITKPPFAESIGTDITHADTVNPSNCPTRSDYQSAVVDESSDNFTNHSGAFSAPNIGTNAFDQKLNLYGKYLTIEFVRLLRPMRKFDSVNDLTTQINHDVRQILAATASELN
jgi:riboflavin kinase/FMN adenylyltransferase